MCRLAEGWCSWCRTDFSHFTSPYNVFERNLRHQMAEHSGHYCGSTNIRNAKLIRIQSNGFVILQPLVDVCPTVDLGAPGIRYSADNSDTNLIYRNKLYL